MSDLNRFAMWCVITVFVSIIIGVALIVKAGIQ